MKKIWSFILVLGFIFICEQTANAVLTNQAPAKFQNVTKKTNNTNSTQTPSDAVWMFINTDEGSNPNYGINKQRFSQYPMTKETIEEIYEYVKYRVNNYETTAKIVHTDVDADLKAGKLFYNFYIKVTSSGEVIKLPVWTIIVQPRFDL